MSLSLEHLGPTQIRWIVSIFVQTILLGIYNDARIELRKEPCQYSHDNCYYIKTLLRGNVHPNYQKTTIVQACSIFKVLNYSLYLSISLMMEGSTQVHLRAQSMLERLPKSWWELCWRAMKLDNFFNVWLAIQFSCMVVFTCRK